MTELIGYVPLSPLIAYVPAASELVALNVRVDAVKPRPDGSALPSDSVAV